MKSIVITSPETYLELTYKYCALDKEKKFGLVFVDDSNFDIYTRWVFFYLGRELSKMTNEPRIYPFKIRDGRVVKKYKFLNNAQRQGKLLANRIIKLS